jgi:hypothetical protein
MKYDFYSSAIGTILEDLHTPYRIHCKPVFCVDAEGGEGESGGSDSGTPDNQTQGEDVSGLKSALEKERAANKTTLQKLKQLEESLKGIDPEKYKQFEALQAQAETWNQEKVKYRTELETEWTGKVKAEQDKYTALHIQHRNLVKFTIAEKAFQGAKGLSGAGDDGITYFDSLMATVSNRLHLTDKGAIEVVDNNGTRLFSAKDATKPMTPQEYFESLHRHPILGHFFGANPAARGGGMNPGSGSGGGKPGQDLSGMSRSERLNALRANR